MSNITGILASYGVIHLRSRAQVSVGPGGQTYTSVDAVLRGCLSQTHTPAVAVVWGDSIRRIAVLRQNTVYSPVSVNTCDVEVVSHKDIVYCNGIAIR